MEKRVRTLLSFLYIGALFVVAVLYFISMFQNDKLLDQIMEREILIRNSRIRDSVNQVRINEYIDKYNNYVREGVAVVNGKKVTTEDLLTLINRQYNDYNELANKYIAAHKSQNELKDTLIYFIKERDKRYDDLKNKFYDLRNRYYKAIDSVSYLTLFYNEAKQKYGIDIKVERRDSTNYFNFIISPADSGLILLKYYRECLEYDSTKNTWTVKIK